MKEINAVLERKVREEVIKVLDQRENEYLPQVILDTIEVSALSVLVRHHCDSLLFMLAWLYLTDLNKICTVIIQMNSSNVTGNLSSMS